MADLADWLALLVTVSVAVLTYGVFQLTRFRIEVAQAKKAALQEVARFAPRVRANYTNALSEDGATLEVRVVLVPKSVGDLEVEVPSLELLDAQDCPIDPASYAAPDLGQFNGTFPADEPNEITYRITIDPAVRGRAHSVRMVFTVSTASHDRRPLATYLHDLRGIKVMGQSVYSDSVSLKDVFSKDLVYAERLYPHGTNPIWDDFWAHPR